MCSILSCWLLSLRSLTFHWNTDEIQFTQKFSTSNNKGMLTFSLTFHIYLRKENALSFIIFGGSYFVAVAYLHYLIFKLTQFVCILCLESVLERCS